MSLKNLLRCSENKQRKEKTQTMKKNFILLLLDLFQLNYLLRNLNASSSLCKTTVVLFSLLFLNFLLFCIISKISMSFLLKTSSDFPELLDCLNDNTAIEANANKYTFVWRGTVNYHLALLVDRAETFFEQYNNLIKAYTNTS